MRIALARLLLSEPDLLLLDEVSTYILVGKVYRSDDFMTSLSTSNRFYDNMMFYLHDSFYYPISIHFHDFIFHNFVIHPFSFSSFSFSTQPTNHLDKGARDWLGDYLSRYDGTLLVVSHDENLLQAAVSSIAEVRSGNVELYKSRSHDQVLHVTLLRRTVLY